MSTPAETTIFPALPAAYLSDIMPPKFRAAAFGLFLANISLGLFIGSVLVTFLPSIATCLLVAFIVSIFGVLFAVVIVPESLPKEKRRMFDTVGGWARVTTVLRGLPEGLAIVVRYPLFVKLCLIIMLSGGAYESFMDISY